MPNSSMDNVFRGAIQSRRKKVTGTILSVYLAPTHPQYPDCLKLNRSRYSVNANSRMKAAKSRLRIASPPELSDGIMVAKTF